MGDDVNDGDDVDADSCLGRLFPFLNGTHAGVKHEDSSKWCVQMVTNSPYHCVILFWVFAKGIKVFGNSLFSFGILKVL